MQTGASMKLSKLLFAGLLLVGSLPAYAGFDEGKAAFDKEDYATALDEWRPLAKHGDALAQFQLGQLYENGFGVEQDDTEAMKWYLKSAKQGNVDAKFNIGLMYDLGEGVETDYVEAMKWYLKAAELGSIDAMRNIGFLYEYGQGVAPDENKADKWRQKAENQEIASSQKIIAGNKNSKNAKTPQLHSQTITPEQVQTVIETYNANEARFTSNYRGKKFSGSMTLNAVEENVIFKNTFIVKFEIGDAEVDCPNIEDKILIKRMVDWDKGQLVSVTGSIEDVTFGDLQLSGCKFSAQKPKELVSEGAAENTQNREAPKGFVSQGGLTWMPISHSEKKWPDANAYCTKTAINGQTGWRLPTKDELIALYNSGAMEDQGWTLFNTWSSTTDSTGDHYLVDLHDGSDRALYKTFSYYVTCVHKI
jgi:hypothetical protein